MKKSTIKTVYILFATISIAFGLYGFHSGIRDIDKDNLCTASADYCITSKDGTKLHVQEYGKGDPVILLAGGPGLNAGYL